MVDLVTEIPLPGRTFSAASSDDRGMPPRVRARSVRRRAGESRRRQRDQSAARIGPSQSRPTILAICGASGTGKTHLARGLVHSWQERSGNDGAEYLTAADFRHALTDAMRHEKVDEFAPASAATVCWRSTTSTACRGRVLAARAPLHDRRLRRSRSDARRHFVAAAESFTQFVNRCPQPVGRRSRTAARPAGGRRPDTACASHIGRVGPAALSGCGHAVWRRASAARLATLFGALLRVQRPLRRPAAADVAAVDAIWPTLAPAAPRCGEILPAVAKYYRVPQKVLKSSTRRQSAVAARAMAIYLARELAELSYERIGQSLGGRDHTTIMHNYRKIAAGLPRDAATPRSLGRVAANLRWTRTTEVWKTCRPLSKDVADRRQHHIDH